MTASPDIKIEIRDLTMAFGSFVVMRDINAQVKRSEVFIIMGASGCGKSTLLRHMIGLKEPATGEIYYDGTPFWQSSAQVRTQKLRSFGVLFQAGSLWSSMTLAENIVGPEPPRVILLAELALAAGLAGLAYAGLSRALRIPELGTIVRLMSDALRRPVRA